MPFLHSQHHGKGHLGGGGFSRRILLPPIPIPSLSSAILQPGHPHPNPLLPASYCTIKDRRRVIEEGVVSEEEQVGAIRPG